MKKQLFWLGVLVVGVVVAPAVSQAASVTPPQGSGFGISSTAGGQQGAKIAIRDKIEEAQPVGMPRTETDEEMITGPSSFGGSDRVLVRGSAIVTPRGGAFMTSKQQADRDIRTLIRKLD